MKRIFVPCDFSETSDTALDYAVQLAAAISGDLLLAHINQYPVMTPEVGLSAYTYQDATKDSLEALEKLSARLRTEHGFTGGIECFSDMGDISSEVLRLSKEKNADLVVTGISSHGNNMVKALIGSSAVSIAKKSEMPVLVVPPETHFRKPAAILYASEYPDEKDLEPGYLQVKEFAGLFGAQVLILHVVQEKGKGGVPSGENYFEHGSHDNQRTYVVHEKNAADGILNFIKDHTVDIVAIEPQKHNFIYNLFHKGVTNELVFHSPVPVLSVHG